MEPEESIRKPAVDYLESWYSGDAERMARAIHPEVAKRRIWTIAESGFLQDCGASLLISETALGEGAKVPEEYRSSTVTLLDVHHGTTTDLAAVKVIGANGVEYLQEGKCGDEWRIINILCEPRDATSSEPTAFKAFTPEKDTQDQHSEEDDAIRKMVRDYTAGWNTGDAARFGGALHPELSKKRPRLDVDGRSYLESWGASHAILAAARDSEGSLLWGRQEGDEGKSEVTILDRCGDIASVKVDWDGIDYLDAVRLDGKWQAVNVVWG